MIPRVLKTIPFEDRTTRDKYLRGLGATFRKMDTGAGTTGTGFALWKTSAGVVLRLDSNTSIAVMSNCTC